MPEPSPNLSSVLRLGRRELIAVVGGCGASSVLLELGRQLEHEGRVVRLGTTTPIDAEEFADLRHFVYEGRAGDRLLGASPVHFDGLLRQGWIEVVGVNADDASGWAAKAPGPDEPVIPRSATHVLAVIGAGALDRVIESVGQHPLRIAAIAGCRPYERLTPERAALVLASPDGGRKHVPPMARFSVVVTDVGADDEPLLERFVAAMKVLDPKVAVIRMPLLATTEPDRQVRAG